MLTTPAAGLITRYLEDRQTRPPRLRRERRVDMPRPTRRTPGSG